MTTTHTSVSNRNRILTDPTTSYWLRDALNASAARDILDALADAEALVEALAAEYAALSARARS